MLIYSDTSARSHRPGDWKPAGTAGNQPHAPTPHHTHIQRALRQAGAGLAPDTARYREPGTVREHTGTGTA